MMRWSDWRGLLVVYRIGASCRVSCRRSCAVSCSAARRWRRPSPPLSSLRATAASSSAKTGHSARSMCAAPVPRRRFIRGWLVNERAQQLRLLEGLLFAATEPLGEEALSRHLDDAEDIPALLRELAESFAGRGVNLVRLAGGWAFRTAPDLAPKLRVERPVVRKLSRAAVETLAVIAYHQPVTRAEIEQIRGVVVAKGTIDALMEARWVRPKGRRAGPGRPLLWVTTQEFLVHFGLESLNDLPGLDELSAAGLLDLAPAVLLPEAATET